MIPLWPRVESARWSLDPLLALTRDVLDMDLALLTEVVDGREEVRRADGAWPGVDPEALPGASLPLEETFCQRLLEGELPAYVADVGHDPTTADLAFARGLGVGAWIGARLNTEDARLYLLCCLSRETRPTLGRREVHALSALATSIATQIDASAL